MSILSLPRTFSNLFRLRQILLILTRHGFSHIVEQLHLTEHVPAFVRMGAAAQTGVEQRSMPERLVLVLQDLGATFIKFGQLLATRPDLIPADYIRALAQLQDRVAPLPIDQIRPVIEKSLGQPLEAVFSRFQETPIASGSIGQVHYAVLRDGTDVVIKVKRPETDRTVREDLDLLSALAVLAEKHLPELHVLRPRMLVDEFARCMERELDFASEAGYTARFAEDFREDSSVVIPRIFWEYTTRDTLVMERITGTSIRNLELISSEDRCALAKSLAHCFLRQFFETGFFHADPHPGNILALGGPRFALLDFGQMGHLSEELRRKLALSLLALAQGDIDFIVELYAEIGVFTEETNLREMKNELASVVNRYYGMPLDRIDMGTVFQEALAIARNYGIFLPRDFVLLGKSFVTILGGLRALDPTFRLDLAVVPFRHRILAEFLSPKTLVRGIGFYLYRFFGLLRQAPTDARDLLEKAKGGRVRIIFHHEGLDHVAKQLERATNRLTIGLIVAAITVGSSIVLAAGRNTLGDYDLPLVGHTPLSVVASGIGFTLAVFMGIWLTISILRR